MEIRGYYPRARLADSLSKASGFGLEEDHGLIKVTNEFCILGDGPVFSPYMQLYFTET